MLDILSALCTVSGWYYQRLDGMTSAGDRERAVRTFSGAGAGAGAGAGVEVSAGDNNVATNDIENQCDVFLLRYDFVHQAPL